MLTIPLEEEDSWRLDKQKAKGDSADHWALTHVPKPAHSSTQVFVFTVMCGVLVSCGTTNTQLGSNDWQLNTHTHTQSTAVTKYVPWAIQWLTAPSLYNICLHTRGHGIEQEHVTTANTAQDLLWLIDSCTQIITPLDDYHSDSIAWSTTTTCVSTG